MATSAVLGYFTGEKLTLTVVWMDGTRDRLGEKLLKHYNTAMKAGDLVETAKTGIRILGDTIEDTEFGKVKTTKDFDVDSMSQVDVKVVQYKNKYRCSFAYVWDEEADHWVYYYRNNKSMIL